MAQVLQPSPCSRLKRPTRMHFLQSHSLQTRQVKATGSLGGLPAATYSRVHGNEKTAFRSPFPLEDQQRKPRDPARTIFLGSSFSLPSRIPFQTELSHSSQRGRAQTLTTCSAQSSSKNQGPPLPSFRVPSLYQSVKLVLGLSVAFLLIQGLTNVTLDLALTYGPPLLTYATMGLVFWPWIAAFALGGLTLVLAARQGKQRQALAASQLDGDTSARPKPLAYLLQQVVVLAGALTWLILVPCAHFQGFLGAWPLSLFSVYVLFFAESAFIRSFLYGDLASKAQDKQWATPSSRLAQVLFVIALVAGHWYAAKESPLTALALVGVIPSRNVPAFVLLFFAIWLHWDSTLILGKYFDRLVPPQLVVMSGPYRWIRHPIYTSYMLLFSGYCVGLRSYKSLAFVLISCLWYYAIRTKIEEQQLVDHFGEEYTAYQKRVDKKFLPYLF